MRTYSRRDFVSSSVAGLVASQARLRSVFGNGADRSFDLRLTFAGLCLFVPDEPTGTMQIVMPPTGHSTGLGAGVPPHAARLVYDVAYEQSNARHTTGQLAHVRLDRKALEFDTFHQNDADLALPEEFLRLDPYVREPLTRDRLGLETKGRVAARVTLGTGQISGWGPGALWTIDASTPRRIAWRLQWTIKDVHRSRLALTLLGLDGTAAQRLPALYPIDGAIDLLICHVKPSQLPPASEMEPEPTLGSPAPDFAAYYAVFDHPAETPIPKYYGNDERASGEPLASTPDGMSEGSADATVGERDASTLITPVCIHAVVLPAPRPSTKPLMQPQPTR
jgi:hypothetical protein